MEAVLKLFWVSYRSIRFSRESICGAACPLMVVDYHYFPLFGITVLLDPQVLTPVASGASTSPTWWLWSPAAPGPHLYLKPRSPSGHCPHIEADQGYYLSMPLLASLAIDPSPILPIFYQRLVYWACLRGVPRIYHK